MLTNEAEGHPSEREAGAPALTKSHQRLLAVAWPITSRIVRAAQRERGVEAHEVFVTLVDLRGVAGRVIAVWTVGEAVVAARLAPAAIDIVPLAVPLTMAEGAAVIAELAPELTAAFAARPRQSITILVIDADDVAGLAVRSSTALLGGC